jgi:hypothetical protein
MITELKTNAMTTFARISRHAVRDVPSADTVAAEADSVRARVR